ncbi:MAG: hypothetical protein KKD44_10745 [Proteobacteria bacterium]|nr:hypothetical protein [Pseudomonadota bacterium]
MRKNHLFLSVLVLTLMLPGLPVQAGSRSQTWTRYPIVLVPGVFDFHNILGMGIDYFYGIEKALEDSSYSPNVFTQKPYHQQTYFIPLNPWQNTTERAEDLKKKLTELMKKNKIAKVNLMAHSHGATTARQAIHMICEEARDKGDINPIASLTTIDAPHHGTPVADYYMENPSNTFNQLMTFSVDLAGNLMALISTGMYEYVGDQHSQEVFKDFSQACIEKFNTDFPSAGLPESTGPYGEGTAENGSPAGDGLGNPMDVQDPEAILYYSWTGNIGNGWSTNWDPFDLVMMATQQMNLAQGFDADADGFIPVKSARFGTVISESLYWNHIDAINQTMGLIDPEAESPKTIFRLHAQRLQKEGR